MIENIYNPIEDLVSDFLGQFIESHKQELCDEDYGLIDAIVTIIISSVPKSSKINTDRICENIKDNFNDNYQFTNESEIVSNTIRDTGAYLYFNLTDDIKDVYEAIAAGESLDYRVTGQYTIETAWQVIDIQFDSSI